MAWQNYHNKKGSWQLNNEGLRSLVHAYCQAKLKQSYTTIEEVPGNFGWGGVSAFGLFDVPTRNIKIDFDRVDREFFHSVLEFENRTKELRVDNLSEETVAFLTDIWFQTEIMQRNTSNKISAVAQANAAAFGAFDSRMAKAMALARGGRDVSITIFLVVASAAAAPVIVSVAGTVASSWGTAGAASAIMGSFNAGGMASVAAVGIGSLAKGAAVFQDGYHGEGIFNDPRLIGDVAITTAGTFATNMIPIPDKSGVVTKALLIVASSALERPPNALNRFWIPESAKI